VSWIPLAKRCSPRTTRCGRRSSLPRTTRCGRRTSFPAQTTPKQNRTIEPTAIEKNNKHIHINCMVRILMSVIGKVVMYLWRWCSAGVVWWCGNLLVFFATRSTPSTIEASNRRLNTEVRTQTFLERQEMDMECIYTYIYPYGNL
jgi:hypothetical protein